MLAFALYDPSICALFHPRMEDAERDFRRVIGDGLRHLEQLLRQLRRGRTHFPWLRIAQFIQHEFQSCKISLRYDPESCGIFGPCHHVHVRALAATQRHAAFQGRNFRKPHPYLIVHRNKFYAGARP